MPTGNDRIAEIIDETYGPIVKSRLEHPVRNPELAVKILEEQYKLIVDKRIVSLTFAAFMNSRPVLYEGPPGTGKTEIGEALLELWSARKPFVLPCSENYDEYKIIGDFHPLLALRKGFNEESFIPRPLLAAFILGTGVLVDEIRRSSEEFHNLLLDIADKRRIIVPELRRAFTHTSEGFQIVFTSNPEDIGQNELSDAFLRRVVRIEFTYPPRNVEEKILKLRMSPDIDIPGDVRSIMLDIIEDLREAPINYKPGTADIVLWARMSQAIASLRGRSTVGIDCLREAALSTLVKRPEDAHTVREIVNSYL